MRQWGRKLQARFLPACIPASLHPLLFSMELKSILESILFSAQKPLSLKELREIFASAVEHAEGNEVARSLKKVPEAQLASSLEELSKDYEGANRSYRLACVAGSWQFVTLPGFAPWLKALVGHKLRPP